MEVNAMGDENREMLKIKSRLNLALRGTAFTIVLLVGMDLLLFIPAGTTDWPAAWIFTLLYGAGLIFFSVFTAINDPDLLKERSRKAKNVKSWDTAITWIYTAFLLLMLILCGLDKRFGWTSVPLPVQIVGLIGVILGGLLLGWVVRENTFLSRYARIQDDRGQRVITTGPYKYVRHPMYAESLFWFPCVPLLLGSFVGLIPGLAISVLYVIRTRLEDKMLMEELPGYLDYAKKTRYRLVPGMW
jgi:protein-S-isoprenylcysteine O-methyltransferase Ste14